MRLAIIALLVLCAASANAGDERDGSAAYGGWRDDRPGLTRHLTAADLPAPETQRVASNGARIVPCPPGFSPRVPPGFAVERVASGFSEPRTLRTAPDGSIFLAESGAGRILVFPPTFADAGAAPHVLAARVFAEGLDQPYGIAFFPPGPAPAFVYIGESGRVLRFPYRPGAGPAAGPAAVIIADLPTGGHWTRDLAAAPDGRHLYVAIGSASNLGEEMPPTPPGGLAGFAAAEGETPHWGGAWGAEKGRAQVRVFGPDGGNARAYATGLRNCSGLAIDPGSGDPWCVVNERDRLGDDLPPDYATHLKPGGFYGWPWFYAGDHEDPRLRGRRRDLAGQVTVPDVLFQPHSAPLGIAFYTAGDFPAAYHGDAFVTFHGSWNRTLRTGYKVVRLLFHDGAPTGAYQDFLTGFALDDDHVCGRPVGVTVSKTGALLISEDANGTIWRVRWTGQE